MNSVELFAGAGGLSLGLEKAGWESQLLLERNRHACNTLQYNKDKKHPLAKNWKIIEGDVRDFDYDQIKSEIDLVAGGPPCQPFSLGGKHNAYSDDRDMFPEAIRAVKELGPKYFVFENVKGLLRSSFSAYFNYIILRLKFPFEGKRESEDWQSHFKRIKDIELNRLDHGSSFVYRVSYKLINAADYGVPQHRHRVIIVGIREDQGWNYQFPEPTHSEEGLLRQKYIDNTYWTDKAIALDNDLNAYKNLRGRVAKISSLVNKASLKRFQTVHDAVNDLPVPYAGGNEEYGNHIFRPGAKPYPGHTGSRLHFPSKAIKAGTHGVPGGENMIAYSDAARIQTFPDNYIFTGSWTESMRQIGNAVPVRLGYILGASLMRQAIAGNNEIRKEESTLQPA